MKKIFVTQLPDPQCSGKFKYVVTKAHNTVMWHIGQVIDGPNMLDIVELGRVEVIIEGESK